MSDRIETIEEFVEGIEALLSSGNVDPTVEFNQSRDGRWEIEITRDQAIVLGMPPCENCGDEFHEHGGVIVWEPPALRNDDLSDARAFSMAMEYLEERAYEIRDTGNSDEAVAFVDQFISAMEMFFGAHEDDD
ncbi:MAG: hypothetical protein JSS68_15135 [Actinobacteria bacterium]|nr:hypothetical protein [Actinomycetota bacterium]